MRAKKAAPKKAAAKKVVKAATAKRAAAVKKHLGKSQSLRAFLHGAGWT
jgi:hypothetical protein